MACGTDNLGGAAAGGLVAAAVTVWFDPALAAVFAGLPLLWGVLVGPVLVYEWGEAWAARRRLRAGRGDWQDLMACWRRRMFWDSLFRVERFTARNAVMCRAVRPVAGGVPPRSPVVLFACLEARFCPAFLLDCLRAGITDRELVAHLDGTRPLDPAVVGLLAGLAPPER